MKSIILTHALTAGLLFIPYFLPAQHAHPAFKQYTVENGLASSEVYQVKQDSKGFIWFATGNGVSRFNGYEFENFSMSNGLPDNTVFEIFEDNMERTWFVPLSCKLSYYYKGKVYPYRYNDTLQKLIRNAIKTSFCVDNSGSVFLGVSRKGIYEITEQGEVKHHFSTPGSVSLHIIEPVTGSLVYANPSVKKNICSINYHTDELMGSITVKGDTGQISSNLRIIRTKNRKILFSNRKRLFIINSDHSYEIKAFPDVINWIYEDRDGDLWIGTLLGGVYYINDYDFKNRKCYLNGISVDGILQDREGGIWFATEENAVYYTPEKHVLTYDESAAWSNEKINCLATGKDAVYAGSQDGFIHRIDNSGRVTDYNYNRKEEHTNGITAIHYLEQEKKLWFSANVQSRLPYIHKLPPFYVPNFFNEVLYDSGTIWIAYANGLRKITPSGRLFQYHPAGRPMKRSNALLKKDGRTMLVGALDGLWEINTANDSLIYLGAADPLLRSRILDLAYTHDSILVVATKGTGLLFYDKGKPYQLKAGNGLSGDNVYKIRTEPGIIWAATNRGLDRITLNRNNGLTFSVTRFTTENGLASNEIKDVIKANGKIWVATNKGLSFFCPDSPLRINAPLPVYINRILINDSEAAVEPVYSLAYNRNNIRISFIALGYKNAGQLSYRYKMLGLDTAWIYTKNREIQFTTLPPNEYTFMLSVLNSNGEWSTEIAKADFFIYAPFWRKWWFRTLLAICILSGIIHLIKYRTRQTQLQKEKSSELNRSLLNLKLKALRAQMNPHFIFNVMNSIQHFIIDKDQESTSRYLSKFSNLIRATLNNSDQNTIPLSEEIKTLRLYLDLEVMRFERKFGYEIITTGLGDTDPEIPPMLIQPYLENSLKHGILPSLKIGRLTVTILREDTFLKCIIEDNGIGRAKAAENNHGRSHKSFGTLIIKERLSVINELYNSTLAEKITDLYDSSRQPIGTRVEIHIPIN